MREHSQMNRGIFMSRESNCADLALLLRLEECFRNAVRREDEVGIILIDDFVNLPDVEVVRLQAAERFLKHSHTHSLVAAVSADLGHNDRLIRLLFSAIPRRSSLSPLW